MVDAAQNARLVLIHGAWQGSWAFQAWLPDLERRGFAAHAVDLPGNGWPPAAAAQASLEAYTEHVVRIVSGLGRRVVLVGHSGGGITASQVAESIPGQIAAVVYLAGMMLPSDTSFGRIIELCEKEAPGKSFAGIAPYLERSADGGTTTVRIEGALKCFVQDCEAAAARTAAELLRPQQESGRLMRPQLTAARFGTVPRVYVECTEDQSVFLPLQRKMQELTPGALRITMHCGHVPQLAQPAKLTELLVAGLDDVLARN
jgi:pimeloyl-ACP methyl ester carboxylesterase